MIARISWFALPGRPRLAALAGLTSLALGACDGPLRPYGCTDAGVCRAEQDVTTRFEEGSLRALDVVFVIDDGPGMAVPQEALRQNLPAFMNVFKALRGGLPDLHLGVVTTSLGAGDTEGIAQCPARGDRGAFVAQPRARQDGCTGPTDRAFIVTEHARPLPQRAPDGSLCAPWANVAGDGDVGAAFACIGDVGTQGCAVSQPLAAAAAALGDGTGAPARNEGFLRDDAPLAVIIVAGHDDCSLPRDSDVFADLAGVTVDGDDVARRCARADAAGQLTPVSWFVQHLRKLKPHPERVIVGVVAPTGASRLRSFADGFGRNGTFVDIEQASWAPVLDPFAKSISSDVGVMCIEGAVRDVDPGAPGLQPDCVVSDDVDPFDVGDAPRSTALPSCDEAPSPCWRLVPDERDCTASGLVLQIDRGGCEAALWSTTTARCSTCADPSDPACARPTP